MFWKMVDLYELANLFAPVLQLNSVHMNWVIMGHARTAAHHMHTGILLLSRDFDRIPVHMVPCSLFKEWALLFAKKKWSNHFLTKEELYELANFARHTFHLNSVRKISFITTQAYDTVCYISMGILLPYWKMRVHLISCYANIVALSFCSEHSRSISGNIEGRIWNRKLTVQCLIIRPLYWYKPYLLDMGFSGYSCRVIMLYMLQSLY